MARRDGSVWILGATVGGRVQYVLWVLAAIGAYGSLLVGYYVPGLGRARTQEWPVRGLWIVLARGFGELRIAELGRRDVAAVLMPLLVFLPGGLLLLAHVSEIAMAARMEPAS
jgi:hypothetical protein